MKTQKRKVNKIIVSLLATSTLVFANNYDFYDNNNHQTSSTKYVHVTKAEPVYERINEKTPFQECWNERVPVQQAYNNPIGDNIGTLIGGIAGGLLGNQIGGGSGKTVATIGGAILGSAVGTNLSKNHQVNHQPRYESVQKCTTKYRYNSKRVLTGYNNIGYYKGQKIVKFANERLRSIPVTITLNY